MRVPFSHDDGDCAHHAEVLVLADQLEGVIQERASSALSPPATDEGALAEHDEHELRGRRVAFGSRLNDQEIATLDSEFPEVRGRDAKYQITRIELFLRHRDDGSRHARID